jgi:hypothetical protein
LSAAKKVGPVIQTDAIPPEGVITFVLDNGATQVIQGSHPFPDGEQNTTNLLHTNPSAFFAHPVSAVFSPQNYGQESDNQFMIYSRRFTEAQEKRSMILDIENALSQKVKAMSLRADIMTISDELITNAIFNAPFVDSENSASGASRDDRTTHMHEGMYGELFIAADADRILVVCRDSYGTLNPEKMLTRVRNCYVSGVAANINMSGGGGAGIGSYMIFNSSISFFVAVHAGKNTVVGCVLPLKGSSRAREAMLKNLHYIFLK